MTLLEIIDTILLGPLKLSFEIIFVIANRVLKHPGLSIIALSLLMNILVLPLYRRADAMQAEARDVEAKLQPGVAHIKKVFSGDERMMILQTYYRQNNYRPTDALNSSVSLLLQIPFFMAAYQFLSNLGMLNHVSFGPIADLSAPDGLLVMGSLTINLLPILMTVINILSSALYLKGFPLKNKLQLYGMAGLFLVLLYDSPSGLVFYWTLNNIFSLVKNLYYRVKSAKKIGAGVLSLSGLALLAFGLFIYNTRSWKRRVFMAAIGLMLQLPMLLPLIRSRVSLPLAKAERRPNRKLFLFGSLFLTVLVGLLIPSTYIAASPQEYVDIHCFLHPMWYIVSSACLSAGFFLIWLGVFYWLASPNGKWLFDRIVWILCGVMLVNYMFFGTELGIINSNLVYADGMQFTGKEQLLNILVIGVVALVLYLCLFKWEHHAVSVALIAAIAMAGMSAINVVTTCRSIDNLSQRLSVDEDLPSFTLSKEGKNVIVFMMDRGLGELVPFIMEEKPELKEQFAGFIYYDNTISFGRTTNLAAPAMMGGYEYTPVEMNKRDTEPLVDKHNEALKVMPLLFAENGYEVTICDPPYAGYRWVPDLSIYDEYPQIQTYNTRGVFLSYDLRRIPVEQNKRNFFVFSIMKTMPLFLQSNIYTKGTYNAADDTASSQIQYALDEADGINPAFMRGYSTLENLANMTKISKEKKNTFLFIDNDATHDPMMLQTPDYVPSDHVDNAEYEAENKDRFILGDRKLNITNGSQMVHYHANAAALLRFGQWLDYLREHDLYDNTRIILVADHGTNLYMENQLKLDTGSEEVFDITAYYPLLMVKDFDSTEFTVSHEFMTNADTPTLAMEGLIDNPVNPFTGKAINADEKLTHPQFITRSWSFHNESTVLQEHSFPQ